MKGNAEFQTRYLEQLHRASGLRDVALEERAVYENDAQAFADGGSNKLPSQLCLRRVILERIRQLNAGPEEEDVLNSCRFHGYRFSRRGDPAPSRGAPAATRVATRPPFVGMSDA